MDEVYIKSDYLMEWMKKKYFPNKELISIDDLISLIEDLDSDIEVLEETKERLNQDYIDLQNKQWYGYKEYGE